MHPFVPAAGRKPKDRLLDKPVLDPPDEPDMFSMDKWPAAACMKGYDHRTAGTAQIRKDMQLAIDEWMRMMDPSIKGTGKGRTTRDAYLMDGLLATMKAYLSREDKDAHLTLDAKQFEVEVSNFAAVTRIDTTNMDLSSVSALLQQWREMYQGTTDNMLVQIATDKSRIRELKTQMEEKKQQYHKRLNEYTSSSGGRINELEHLLHELQNTSAASGPSGGGDASELQQRLQDLMNKNEGMQEELNVLRATDLERTTLERSLRSTIAVMKRDIVEKSNLLEEAQQAKPGRGQQPRNRLDDLDLPPPNTQQLSLHTHNMPLFCNLSILVPELGLEFPVAGEMTQLPKFVETCQWQVKFSEQQQVYNIVRPDEWLSSADSVYFRCPLDEYGYARLMRLTYCSIVKGTIWGQKTTHKWYKPVTSSSQSAHYRMSVVDNLNSSFCIPEYDSCTFGTVYKAQELTTSDADVALIVDNELTEDDAYALLTTGVRMVIHVSSNKRRLNSTETMDVFVGADYDTAKSRPLTISVCVLPRVYGGLLSSVSGFEQDYGENTFPPSAKRYVWNEGLSGLLDAICTGYMFGVR
jgi:hypothetical protein